MGDQNDDEIIQSILSGNTDEFEVILKRYDQYVFNIIAKHLPREMVEEAAHEVFIRVYKALPSYRAEAPFKYWLSKIAERYCYDYWREKYKAKEVPMASLTDDHSQWVESVLSDQSQKHFEKEELLRESKEVLQWALNKLTAEDRMVITLLYLEELSVKETADLLGWSVINVKVRAHRSRNKLRKIISSLLGQEGGHQ
ncbi:MAG TPA: RNA polymerase sigma factor [Dissulfurispiraceae bacterium]|nr:RNA polymerase sigma factor [Dissulfurispiraceae bacterium]